MIFESYIAARVVRARRALTIAKVALLRDPRDQDKREALRRAEAQTNELQAQLLGQVRKASQARARAKGARATPVAATPVPEEVPIAQEATVDFRALQAAKVEPPAPPASASLPRRRTSPDDRDCPSCGHQADGGSTACACGYRFDDTGTDGGTAAFISDDEIVALRAGAAASTK